MPAAKYWITKRCAGGRGGRRCLGGNGYVEESGPCPGLVRESPRTPSGRAPATMQALDVLRALQGEPGRPGRLASPRDRPGARRRPPAGPRGEGPGSPNSPTWTGDRVRAGPGAWVEAARAGPPVDPCWSGTRPRRSPGRLLRLPPGRWATTARPSGTPPTGLDLGPVVPGRGRWISVRDRPDGPGAVPC
ncbi:hypothetical protein LT493_39650 [Streptomyces tricolor]|nr:hypothetical protein [Streptomyces tricolor]